jgi:uncharacterized membrane protein
MSVNETTHLQHALHAHAHQQDDEHPEILPKARLEAFSDGVFSVIVTIMVIDLKSPDGETFADLGDQMKLIGLYLLSFVYVSIYWTNHHVFLHVASGVDGTALWANLFLLFSLSLLPFTTRWMGEHFEPVPVCVYGLCLLLCAFMYGTTVLALASVTLRHTGTVPHLLKLDWKFVVSTLLYGVGAGVSIASPYAGIAMYMAVAAIWFCRIFFSRCIHVVLARQSKTRK